MLTLLTDWVNSLTAEEFTKFVAVVAAAWALFTFRRNTKSKHAELLLKLEEDYRANLKTMLRIEYLAEYRKTFLPAIDRADPTKSDPPAPDGYTPEQSAAIDELEAMLRHFLMACHLRELGVGRRAIDSMHAYYLRVFIDKDHDALNRYMKRYWPTVRNWAYLAGRPWMKRASIYVWQLPERVSSWLSSRASEPDPSRAAGQPAPGIATAAKPPIEATVEPKAGASLPGDVPATIRNMS